MFSDKVITNYSSSPTLNVIKGVAESMAFDTECFKCQMPVFTMSQQNEEHVWLHYLHILKNGNMVISIYYDTKSLAGVMPCPYFEIYDRCDTDRFFDTREGRKSLVNDVRERLEMM